MNLSEEIALFLAKTPIREKALADLLKQASEESWLVALNTYIRLHNTPLEIANKLRLTGETLDTAKQKIIEHLKANWL